MVELDIEEPKRHYPAWTQVAADLQRRARLAQAQRHRAAARSRGVMAELDVDALKRLRDEYDQESDVIRQLRLYDEFNGFAWDQWPAIIAALEDRDRLRAAARRLVERAEQPYGGIIMIPYVNALRAALEEGRGG